METDKKEETSMKFVHLVKSVRTQTELQEARQFAQQHGFQIKEENVPLVVN